MVKQTHLEKLFYPLIGRLPLHLVVMQLNALSPQPASAHGPKAETTSQELQPDGGEQGGGLEGATGTVCAPQLAALLLHP